jgi:hypothetical protein
MRRLVLAISLVSLAATPHFNVAASRRSCECPSVAVSCADVARTGEAVTFTVTVNGADADAKPTYNWTVSSGTIQSGQGTNSIVVDTLGLPGNSSVTATVDVKGLPESCTSSASCTTALMLVIVEDRIDEYGDIKFEYEMARLDNFAIELLNWPQGTGYIVAYGGRVGRRGEAMKRAERAKEYLTKVRYIPTAQVVIIDGGYHEHLMLALKLRGRDAPPPVPSPTVDPTEVRFINSAPKTGARHRAARRGSAKTRARVGL